MGECVAGAVPFREQQDWFKEEKAGLLALTYDLVGPIRILLKKRYQTETFASIMSMEVRRQR